MADLQKEERNAVRSTLDQLGHRDRLLAARPRPANSGRGPEQATLDDRWTPSCRTSHATQTYTVTARRPPAGTGRASRSAALGGPDAPAADRHPSSADVAPRGRTASRTSDNSGRIRLPVRPWA